MLVLTVLFLSLSPMFQRATVVQMDLTDCAAPKHSILSALSGAPDTVQRDSCAEYVLSSPTVIFRLQAKRSEVLMVPGDVVSFRTGKGKLYLRRDDDDGEVEATVLCMRSARTPAPAVSRRRRLNPIGPLQLGVSRSECGAAFRESSGFVQDFRSLSA